MRARSNFFINDGFWALKFEIRFGYVFHKFT